MWVPHKEYVKKEKEVKNNKAHQIGSVRERSSKIDFF